MITEPLRVAARRAYTEQRAALRRWEAVTQAALETEEGPVVAAMVANELRNLLGPDIDALAQLLAVSLVCAVAAQPIRRGMPADPADLDVFPDSSRQCCDSLLGTSHLNSCKTRRTQPK